MGCCVPSGSEAVSARMVGSDLLAGTHKNALLFSMQQRQASAMIIGWINKIVMFACG